MRLHFANGQVADVRLDRVVDRGCALRREIENKNFAAPVGARFVITGFSHMKGFSLALEKPCCSCGLTGVIYGVEWDAVVIDGEPPRPPSKAALEAARKLGGDEAAEHMTREWRKIRYR